MSILLKGGRVVNFDSSIDADVLIEDGVIVNVGTNLTVGENVKVIDVTNKLVMPGGIDPHTHFNLPFMGTSSVDNFESGSKAALAGGTTTVKQQLNTSELIILVDFVIPNPGQSLIEAWNTWSEWASICQCNYSFHVAVTWWSEQVSEEMKKCAEMGTNSFKHFLAYKGSLQLDDEMLCKSFERAKELNCIVTENGELLARQQQKILEMGITGPEGHPLSRPPEIEAEATNRACVFAHTVKVPLYVVHCSCKQSIDHIARSRSLGWKVFGEVLACHLTIDDSVYFDNRSWEEAAAFILSPPIRPKENLAALWDALKQGTIQTTATDNCTFCAEQKAMGKDNFTKIPNGVNGVEDRVSVLFDDGVLGGKLTENEFVNVTSTNAARIFNMFPKKGIIAIGSDADIVVIDPNVKRTISKNTQYLKNGHNIWEGREIKGVSVLTICNGNVVWTAHVEDGVAQWDKGTFSLEGHKGKFISRPGGGFAYENLQDYPWANQYDESTKKYTNIVRNNSNNK